MIIGSWVTVSKVVPHTWFIHPVITLSSYLIYYIVLKSIALEILFVILTLQLSPLDIVGLDILGLDILGMTHRYM